MNRIAVIAVIVVLVAGIIGFSYFQTTPQVKEITITRTVTMTSLTKEPFERTIVTTVSTSFTKTVRHTVKETVKLTQTLVSTITKTLTVKEEKKQQYPIIIVDGFNRKVRLEKEPQRIISLAPSVTEIIYAIGAESKLVGVDSYSNYPQALINSIKAGIIQQVGGIVDPSLEKIASLKPDLIITGLQMQNKLISTLEAKGFKVIGLGANSISDVYNGIIIVGKALNKINEAESLVKSMKLRINLIKQKIENVPKVKVYYEVWYDPLISVAKGSFIHEVIEAAGGENIFKDAKNPYPVVSVEAIIELNPDVIVLGTHSPNYPHPANRTGWSVISAVKNKRVYFIDPDIINRSGPRVVDAVEMLAKMFHPELFKEEKQEIKQLPTYIAQANSM